MAATATVESGVYSSLKEAGFVGRERELNALQRQADRAVRGNAVLACLEAESGRGKSRLLKEFSRRLGGTLFMLEGQGVDRSAQRPFQLFVPLFKRLVSALAEDQEWRDALKEDLRPYRDALLTIAPEMSLVWEGEERVSLPEGFGEERSLRALVALLDAVGRPKRPAIVLLDDVQWADELSLKLISSWSKRGQQPAPVLIVAAYRSECVSEGHPLKALAADEIVRLGEFGAADMRALLESMAGGLTDDVLELVTRLSSGNPFMAVSVMRGLTESGVLRKEEGRWQLRKGADNQDLASAHEAGVFLRRRIELLPPQVINLLKVAAVLGKEFESELAASVAGTAPGDAREVWEHAAHRHIIAPSSEGKYQFVHDKLRETLLNMLNGDERKLLCLKVAADIEATNPSRVFDLAYYLETAGEMERAAPYAFKAAAQARASYSLQLAEEQYRIALSGMAQAAPAERYEVLLGLGDVLMLRGKYDEAHEIYELARPVAGDRYDRTQVVGRIAELAFKRGENDRAIVLLEQAVEEAGVRVPKSQIEVVVRMALLLGVQGLHLALPKVFLYKRPLRGRDLAILLTRLCTMLSYAYWFGAAGKYRCFWSQLCGLNRGERYHATPDLAHAYSAISPGMSMIPLFPLGLQYSTRAIALCRQLGDFWGEGQAFSFQGVTQYAASQLSQCADSCLRASKILGQAGDLWEKNIANCNVAYAFYRLGNLPEGARLSAQIHREAVEIMDKQSYAVTLAIWAKCSGGDIPVERIAWTREHVSKTDVQALCELATAEALYCLNQGDFDGALRAMEAGLKRLRQSDVQSEYVVPVFPWYVTALRRRIETLPCGESASARALMRKAKRLKWLAAFKTTLYRNNLSHNLREYALLAALSGRERAARAGIERSIKAAQELDMRFEYAQSLYARGRIGERFGWPEAGRDKEEAQALLKAQGNFEAFRRIEKEV